MFFYTHDHWAMAYIIDGVTSYPSRSSKGDALPSTSSSVLKPRLPFLIGLILETTSGVEAQVRTLSQIQSFQLGSGVV